MRVKVTPDDFVVTEIVNLTLSGKGHRETKVGPSASASREPLYRVYLLEKVGWNTLDAIRSIATHSDVDPRLIGYAGLKDRHARTSQHVSVPAWYQLVSGRDDIRLTFLGFSHDFVSTKVLVGNRFSIRIGGLVSAEADALARRMNAIQEGGFPNYFDDQRFGSVTPEGDFMAERLVKGHLKGALKIHLGAVFPTQKKAERESRAKVNSAWGKWDEVLSLCETEEDRAVAIHLAGGASKKNLLAALNAVPQEVMSRYIAAYQAHIWNEVLRRVVRDAIASARGTGSDGRELSTSYEVPGKAGSYWFPQNAGLALAGLRDLEIPTVSARMLPCEPPVSQVIESVLAERGIEPRHLYVRGLRSGYFKSFLRKAVVVPESLRASSFVPDRENGERWETGVSFALPAGSYATMLLKALTGGV